jgi:hypothetical protein
LPQPSAWKKDQLYIFLNNHEFVAQGKDLDFIRGKIKEYKNKLNLEFNKQKKKPDETSWDWSGWGGIVPNVRLLEIILSDDLRINFLHRNDADSRTEYDAHGTESQPLSFFEKV